MRGALLVCKKEFMELSKDRKTMFFTFLMPLILYPLIFTMMSKLSQNDKASRTGKASTLRRKSGGRRTASFSVVTSWAPVSFASVVRRCSRAGVKGW